MAYKQKILFAVIGGSGLYDLDDAELIDTVTVTTPWGGPSDDIKIVRIEGNEIAFLARHGSGHRLKPTEVPYQANIAALRHLGVQQIVAFTAVGSLKEELKPTDFVIPDQIIDRTFLRPNTFYGGGIAGHIGFADPFCPTNEAMLIEAARQSDIECHHRETVVCMEGPAFSTRAESHLYRSWGAGLINMTVIPEAKLAREAEICYNSVAMVTDYDCWRREEEAVTASSVIEYLQKNSSNARKMLRSIAQRFHDRPCSCRQASAHAVITNPDAISDEARGKMRFILPDRF